MANQKHDFYMIDKQDIVDYIVANPARLQIAFEKECLLAEIVSTAYFTGPMHTRSIIKLVPSKSIAYVLEGGVQRQDTIMRCLQTVAGLAHAVANDPCIRSLLGCSDRHLLGMPSTKQKVRAVMQEIRDIIVNEGLYCGYSSISKLVPCSKPNVVPLEVVTDLMITALKSSVPQMNPNADNLRAAVSSMCGRYSVVQDRWFKATKEGGWRLCANAVHELSMEMEKLKESITIKLREAWEIAFDSEDTQEKALYGTCSRHISNISHMDMTKVAISLIQA